MNRAFCEFFLPKLCGGDCVGIPRGRQCTRSASEPLTLARSRILCACERGVRSAAVMGGELAAAYVAETSPGHHSLQSGLVAWS
jgi:hypothetical protein